MRPWIVAITGASGVAYGVRLVQVLLETGQRVALVCSDPARLVMKEELGVAPKNLTQAESFQPAFELPSVANLEVFSAKDLSAPIASGSFPVAGMVVIPCSMGTLGHIAFGTTQNLIHRAADCMLKEGRRLILVPRETPLNAVHLENMLKLARLGVKMVPAMPGFYSGAKNLSEVVDFMVGKVMDQMELNHALYPRWTGSMKGQVLDD